MEGCQRSETYLEFYKNILNKLDELTKYSQRLKTTHQHIQTIAIKTFYNRIVFYQNHLFNFVKLF
jgi:hypothetical protein